MFMDLAAAFLGDRRFQVHKLDDQLYDYQTLAFKKDSEFTELFSHHLKIMEEGGILPKLRSDWIPSLGIDSSTNGITAEANILGFENLAFPFMILTIGSIVAFATSIIEYLIKSTR